MSCQETFVQLDQAVALFTRERPRLFSIAYRIVGNTADAEDVVQDVWMRWQSCDRSSVQAPAALSHYNRDAARNQCHHIGTCAPRNWLRLAAVAPLRSGVGPGAGR